jgi:phosphatidylinositol glycan class S
MPSAIPLHIWITAPGIACHVAERIIQDTQQVLDDLNEYPTLHQRLHLVNSLSASNNDGRGRITKNKSSCGQDPAALGLGDPALKILLEEGTQAFEFDVKHTPDSAIARVSSTSGSGAGRELAVALQSLYREEQIAAALQTVTLASHTNKAQAFLKSQPYDVVTRVEKQLNRAYKPSPAFHLTFSLFSASGAPSSWDVQAMLEEHIQPAVQAISKVAEIQITTQVQLYSSYSSAIHPIKRNDSNSTILQQSDLTAFVNAAEWPLTPSIGEGPTINFILYIPTTDQIPLAVEGIDRTSWLIPQWGGIQILNPDLTPHPETGVLGLPIHLDRAILRQPFNTFAAQLLSLLGILQAENPGNQLPLHLRLEAYSRLSALTLYLKAASSLGSLARLAQHLNNIPIPKNVAQLVDDTISNLTTVNQNFLESRWTSALSHAKTAYRDSEKAFFDKSMVGQVYFPDEHKIAVYLPLLGPIGVPLLVGLIREVKRLVSRVKGANG